MAGHMPLSEKLDEYEEQKLKEFETKIVTKSLLYYLAEGEHPIYSNSSGPGNFGHGKTNGLLMGEDPRLPKMPEKPTFTDFLRHRFTIGGQQHLLQSARLAKMNGLPEKLIFACLMHDIAICGFIRSDHGYWGAQMIAPYVDEEVSWAIKMHQCIRFFPDPSNNYEYPESYRKMFGVDYQPEPYIVAEYKSAKKHKWYMTALEICKNDHYAFDPNILVNWEEFEDVVGRNFKQPPEGLGNDNSPSAHIWRTLRRPCNAL